MVSCSRGRGAGGQRSGGPDTRSGAPDQGGGTELRRKVEVREGVRPGPRRGRRSLFSFRCVLKVEGPTGVCKKKSSVYVVVERVGAGKGNRSWV